MRLLIVFTLILLAGCGSSMDAELEYIGDGKILKDITGCVFIARRYPSSYSFAIETMQDLSDDTCPLKKGEGR